MLGRICILEDAFRRYQFENVYRHFRQSSKTYLSQIDTLYTNFKDLRATFYSYKTLFFSQSFHLLPRATILLSSSSPDNLPHCSRDAC